MTYAQQSAMDPTGDEPEAFVAEMSAVLQANNGLDVYKKILSMASWFCSIFDRICTPR